MHSLEAVPVTTLRDILDMRRDRLEGIVGYAKTVRSV
jgi:hypothetical protein